MYLNNYKIYNVTLLLLYIKNNRNNVYSVSINYLLLKVEYFLQFKYKLQNKKYFFGRNRTNSQISRGT